MKEFSQSTGPFKKWKDREIIRRNFLRDGTDIIRQRAQRWLLCCVHHQLFDITNARYRVRETLSSPYAIAGRACVAQVNSWNADRAESEDIEFIFEDGGPDKGGLHTALEVPFQLPDAILRPSRDMKDKKGNLRKGVIQLQAADLLAYEVRKNRREFAVRSGRATRQSFYQLLRVPAIVMATFNEHNVQSLCHLERPLEKR